MDKIKTPEGWQEFRDSQIFVSTLFDEPYDGKSVEEALDAFEHWIKSEDCCEEISGMNWETAYLIFRAGREMRE